MDNFDVMCLEYENSINNLNSEFDIMMLEYAQNINNIETHCILESVDNDSLVSLYTEEVEKVKDKSEGILKKIIRKIKEFLNKIKKAIFGDKTTAEASTDVTVEDDPKEIEKENKKWTDSVKKFISGNKKPLLILTGAITATGAAVGTGLAIKKKRENSKDEIKIDGKTSVIIRKKDTKKAMKTCQDVIEDTDKCVRLLESKTDEVAKTSSPEELVALKTGVNELQKNANKAAKTSKKIKNKSQDAKNASGTDITRSDISKYEMSGKFDKKQLYYIDQGLKDGLDVSKYDNPKFNSDQMKHIMYGLDDGLDVSKYADPKFDSLQMYQIKCGLSDGLDISKYANPKFRSNQMSAIKQGLKDGVDVSIYADPKYPSDKMNTIRSILNNLKDDKISKYHCKVSIDFVKKDMLDADYHSSKLFSRHYLSEEEVDKIAEETRKNPKKLTWLD